MKRACYIAIISIMLLALVSCKKAAEEPIEPSVEEEVTQLVNQGDEGEKDPLPDKDKPQQGVTIEGQWQEDTYINGFFGFSIVKPEGWHRISSEELFMIEATGESIVEAESEIDSIFGVSEYPIGEHESFNPSLLINVYEGDYTNDEILEILSEIEESLLATGAEFDFEPAMPALWLGAIEGTEMYMSIPMEEDLIIQNFFVGVMDGWVIEVTATYSEEDAELFSEMLSN